MPSTIPFNHPSLVLGHVADTGVIDLCNQIQGFNSQIDSAHETLNSLIEMKRSISMTLNEISDMGVDTDAISETLKELDAQIIQATNEYVKTRIENEKLIQSKKTELAGKSDTNLNESPLDFDQSKLIELPLASSSMKFDSQYFSFGSTMQDDTMANIEKFVKQNTGETDKSNSLAKAASQAVQNQFSNHSISGTLIIAASCTYANVKMFNPVAIDPDKGIAIWNKIFSNDLINVELLSQPKGKPENNSTKNANSLPLIVGTSLGSSFIGMVHILKSKTSNSADIESIKNEMDQKLKIGGWLENAIGGYGVNANSLREVKAMLDTNKVASHISVITTGAIPSIASSKLNQGLSQITRSEIKLPVVGNDANATHESTASDAEKARELAQFLSIERARSQNIMENLSRIDYEANQSFDINSLIDAFDNYVKDRNSNSAVPIGFHIRHVTRNDLQNLWVNKYFPTKKTSDNTNQ